VGKHHCNFPKPDADGSIPGQRIEIECSECARLKALTMSLDAQLAESDRQINQLISELQQLTKQLGQECPTCQRWKGTKFPIVLAVRDLEITIDKKE